MATLRCTRQYRGSDGSLYRTYTSSDGYTVDVQCSIGRRFVSSSRAARAEAKFLIDQARPGRR